MRFISSCFIFCTFLPQVLIVQSIVHLRRFFSHQDVSRNNFPPKKSLKFVEFSFLEIPSKLKTYSDNKILNCNTIKEKEFVKLFDARNLDIFSSFLPVMR